MKPLSAQFHAPLVVLVCGVSGILVGCPNPGTSTGTRESSRASISGRVRLENVPGLNDFSRVRVDLGRGEGGVVPDENGDFEVSDLEPDVYSLALTYVGGLTPEASRSAYQRLTTRVVARAGGDVNVGELRPRLATGTVSGNVPVVMGGPTDSSTGANVKLVLSTGETRTAVVGEDGTFSIPDVPVGTHAVSVTKTGYARAPGPGGCVPSVRVIEEEGQGVAEGLGLAPTQATLQPGSDQVFGDTSGTRWFVRGEELTVNAVAGFARRGRAWRQGDAAPAYDVLATPGVASFPVTGLPPGTQAWNFQLADGCEVEGYESPVHTLTLVRDTVAPALLRAELGNGEAVLGNPSTTLLLLAEDALSPTLQMRTLTCRGTPEQPAACDPAADFSSDSSPPWVDFSSQQAVNLPAQDPTGDDGARVVLVQLRDLSQNVLDPPGAAAVRVDTQAPAAPVVTAETDAQGRVFSTQVRLRIQPPADAIQMQVSVDGVPQGWRAVDTVVEASVSPIEGDKVFSVVVRDVVGNEGAPGTATATLRTRGNVGGSVTLADGGGRFGPLAADDGGVLGARVRLTQGADGGAVLETTADAQGRFSFVDVPAGSWVLRAEGPVGGRAYRAEQRDVLVVAGQPTPSVDVVLALLTGRVTGTVLLEGSSDASAATVFLEETRVGGRVLAVPVRTDGSLGPEEVPLGGWRGRAVATGYNATSLGEVVLQVEGQQEAFPGVSLARADSGGVRIDGAPYTRTQDVTLLVDVAGATGIRASEQNPVTGTFEGVPADGRYAFTLSPGDGLKTVYVELQTPAGVRTATPSIILDRGVPRILQLRVNGGEPFTRTANVPVTLTAVDDVTAVSDMRFSVAGVAGPTRRYAEVSEVVLSGMDGPYEVSAWVRDQAQNETPNPTQTTLFLDTRAPLPGAVAVQGAVDGAVRDTDVVLVFNATDPCLATAAVPDPRGCAEGSTTVPHQLVVSELADFAGAVWTPYVPMLLHRLSPADGNKTLHVRFRDRAGNESSPPAVTIRLDRTPPTQGTLVLAGGAQLTNQRTITAAPGGIGFTRFRVGYTEAELAAAPLIPFGAGATGTVTLPDQDGLHLVRGELWDDAGNITRVDGRITLDRVAPTVLLTLEEGTLTRVPDVHLRVVALDANGLAALPLQVANGPIQGSTPRTTYSPAQLDWNLHAPAATGLDGPRTVTVRVTDAAGNVADATADITLDSTAPGAPGTPRVTARAGRFPSSGGGVIGAGGRTNDAFPAFSWVAAADAVAYRVELSNGTTFTTVARSAVFTGVQNTLPFVLEDGPWTWRVVALDLAGNSSTAAGTTFHVDTVPPAAPALTLNGGSATTTSPSVVAVATTSDPAAGLTLVITGDVTGGVQQLAFPGMPFMVNLTNTDGDKTVQAVVRDDAGNESTGVTRTVRLRLDATAPVVTRVQVGNGSGYVADAQGLTSVSVDCTDNLAPDLDLVLVVSEGTTNLYSGAYLPAVPVTLGAEEMGHTLTARCRDPAGNEGSLVAAPVVVDHTPPSLSGVAINAGAAATNDPIVQVSYTATDVPGSGQVGPASGVTALAFGFSAFACATGNYSAPAQGPAVLTLTGADGNKGVFACARDAAGNLSSTTAALVDSIDLDRVAPASFTFVLNGGNAFAQSGAVTASATTADVPATGYTVSISGQVTPVNAAPSASIPLALSGGTGLRTVTAVLTDAAGNASVPVVRTVTVDNTEPAVTSVAIHGGAAFVTATGGATTVDVACSDAAAPSNLLTLVVTDAGNGSTLYSGPYASRVPITLGTTAGTRTVSAVCVDPAGNTSTAVQDSVVVDLLAPTVTAFSISGTAGAQSSSAAVQVTYALADGAAGSGPGAVALSETTPFNCATASYTYPAVGPVAFTLSAGDGTKRLYLCARDAAGNVTATATTSNDLVVDTQPDGSGTLTLAGGARATSSVTVGAVVAGRPAGSVIRVGGDVTAPTTDQATDSFNITLRSGDGPKTVFMQFVDAVGNVGALFSYTITLDTQAPSLTAFRVGNGGGYVNDANGLTTAEVSCSDAQTPSGQMLLTVTETSAMPTPVQRYNSTYLPVVTLPLTSTESTRTLRATCTDLAGNAASSGAAVADVTVVVDHTAPVLGAFTVNGGASATNNPLLTLAYTTSDTGGAGVLGVAVGTSAFTCSGASYVLGGTGGTLAVSGADGARSVYACVSDRAGNVGAITSPLAGSITLDRVAPGQLSFSVQGGAAFVGGATVTLSAGTTDTPSTGYRLRITGDLAAPVDVLLAAAPATLTLSAGEGPKTLSASLVDPAGNALPVPVVRTIHRDGTAPSVTRVAIHGGAAFVNASGGLTTVDVGCSDLAAPSNQLTLTVRDAANMAVLFSGAYAERVPITLGTTQGTRQVSVTCADPAGNTSAAATDPDGVFVDTAAPVISSFTLNGGGAGEPTASALVTLNVSVTDGALSGGVEYAVAEAGSAFACGSASYGALPASLGLDKDPDRTIRVYLCVRDRAGNLSGTNATAASNTLVLDTQPPGSGTLTLAAGASAVRVNTGVAVTLTGIAGVNAVLQGDIVGSPITLIPAPASTTVTLLPGDGEKRVEAIYVDAAGNESRPFGDAVVLDTVAPVVRAAVAPNAPLDPVSGFPVVTSPLVDVQVSSRDADKMALWDTSAVTPRCGNACTVNSNCSTALGEQCVEGFCGMPCSSANYVPFDPLSSFAFTSTAGLKNLCMQFCDAAGNSTRAEYDTVKLKGNRPRPTLESITVLSEMTTPPSCTVNANCGGTNVCADGRCWAPSVPGSVLVSLSAPRFRLAATGTGIAADTRLVIGDFTLQCTGGDPEDNCAEGQSGTCGMTCSSPAANCSALDSTGCIQDEVTRNGGVYAARLLTPDPVLGGLGESAETELLYVRSPAPDLLGINIHGVTEAATGPSEVILACTRKVTDNAEFRIGQKSGVAVPCLAPDLAAAACPVDAQCWRVEIKPWGLPAMDLVDYAFEVSNPVPGGGAASLPFGINPNPTDCPLGTLCTSNLRGTRAVESAVTGVFQGYGFDGISLSGLFGWTGGSAASVGLGPARLSRVHASGYLRVPPLAFANRVYLESASMTAEPVWMRPIATHPTGLAHTSNVSTLDRATVGAGPVDLAMGDLDLDGLPDLVTINEAGLGISVLRRAAPGSAFTREEYATYAPGGRVLLTDLNRDGFQDVVACSFSDSQLEARLNDGTGRFGARMLHPYGSSAASCRAMASADMNRDGLPDVVVVARDPAAPSTGTRVWTLLSDGAGDLNPTAITGTPITAVAHVASQLEDVTLSDVDHDGWMDAVLVGGLDIDAASPMRGYAMVMFSAAGALSTATAPNTLLMHAAGAADAVLRRVALADVNHDGVKDIVATHTSTLSTPPGRGSTDSLVVRHLFSVDGTTVQSGSALVAGAAQLFTRGPVGLAMADVDADGFLDAVVATAPNVSGAASDNRMFTVCPGNGTTFGNCYDLTDGAGLTDLVGHPMSVVVADMDSTQDGYLDVAYLVPGVLGGTSAQVWIRRTGATLGAAHGQRVSLYASNVVGQSSLVGKDIEVTALNTGLGGQVLTVHANQLHVHSPSSGSPVTYTLPLVSGVSPPLSRIAVGQLNGDADRRVDVVAAAPGPSTAAGLFLVPGAGGGTLCAASPPTHPDCVALSYTTVQLSTAPAADVVTADVNLDGRLDILFITNSGVTTYRRLGVLMRNPTDTAYDALDLYTLDTAAVDYSRLAVGDLNGDGFPDVVALRAVTSASTAVAYALGAGTGGAAGTRFAAAVRPTLSGVPGGAPNHTLVVTDADADGRSEVLFSYNSSGSGVLRAYSPGALPTFTQRTALSLNVGGAFDVADITGDNLPELVTQDQNGRVTFLRGVASAGLFTTSGPSIISRAGANRLRIADLDGDGARDVVFDNPQEDSFKMWLSDTPGVTSMVLRAGDFPPATAGRAALALAVGQSADITFSAAPVVVKDAAVRLRVTGAGAAGLDVSLRRPGMAALPVRNVAMACGGTLANPTDQLWRSSDATACGTTLADLAGKVVGAGNWVLTVTNGHASQPVQVEDAEITVDGWLQRETPGRVNGLSIPLGGSTYHRGTLLGMDSSATWGNGNVAAHVVQVPVGKTSVEVRATGTFEAPRLYVHRSANPDVCQPGASTTLVGSDTVAPLAVGSMSLTSGHWLCIRVSSNASLSADGVGPYDLSVRFP